MSGMPGEYLFFILIPVQVYFLLSSSRTGVIRWGWGQVTRKNDPRGFRITFALDLLVLAVAVVLLANRLMDP